MICLCVMILLFLLTKVFPTSCFIIPSISVQQCTCCTYIHFLLSMLLKVIWYVVRNRYSLFVCSTEIHLATILCTSPRFSLIILFYCFLIYYCHLGLKRRFPMKCLLMSSINNISNNLKSIAHIDVMLKLFYIDTFHLL